MQIPVLLDRSRREPLTSQLVEQLRDAIRHARIRGGTRLPSSRRLAEQLAVSRNTVIRAYDTLIVEGYVESRPASGIFVADSAARECRSRPHSTRQSRPEPASLSHMPHAAIAATRAEPRRSAPQPLVVRFLSGPSERGVVSCSKPGAACCRPTSRTAATAGCRNTATRPDYRRCARRSPTIWRRRAASLPIRAASSLSAALRRAPALRRGCSSITARQVRSRIPAIRARPSPSKRPAPRWRASPVDFEGLIPEELPQRPTALLYHHAVAPVPDRAHVVAASPPRDRRLGATLRLLHSGRRSRRRSSLRRLAVAGDCRYGAGLHDLSRHVFAFARRRPAAGLHGRSRAARRRRQRRKGAAQQRQPLARTVGARRDDARRVIRGASAARPARATRKAAITCSRRCAVTSATSA